MSSRSISKKAAKPILLRPTPEEREALEQEAERQSRSLGNLALHYMRQGRNQVAKAA